VARNPRLAPPGLATELTADCPRCGAPLTVSPAHPAGTLARCGDCRGLLVVSAKQTLARALSLADARRERDQLAQSPLPHTDLP
jgi:hypothetical protein